MRRRCAALLLIAVLGLTGCAGTTLPVGNPAPSTSTSAPAALVVPNVVGQNADVAVDVLHRTGFTNIDLGTVDGRRVVILPQNWTVRQQSAKPGTRLAATAKIVLGCARIGGARWL